MKAREQGERFAIGSEAERREVGCLPACLRLRRPMCGSSLTLRKPTQDSGLRPDLRVSKKLRVETGVKGGTSWRVAPALASKSVLPRSVGIESKTAWSLLINGRVQSSSMAFAAAY